MGLPNRFDNIGRFRIGLQIVRGLHYHGFGHAMTFPNLQQLFMDYDRQEEQNTRVEVHTVSMQEGRRTK